MWPIDDQRLRREHEFLRSTQESVYNGTSANTYAPLMNPSTSLQAQLSHERQLAMIELHQRLQASAQASSAVTASMFPHGMGTGDRGYHHDPIGMQHVMSASVSSSEISRLNLLRHLRFREERELLEHRLVFTRQMEEAHRHEIIGRNAIEAANNYLHQSSASEAAQAERTIAASSSKRNGKSNTSLTIEELVPTVSCSPRSEASGSNEKVKAQVLKKDLNGKKLPPSIKTRKSKKKDSRWLETLEELKEYRLKNGHCVIPRGYSQNPRLANWVAEQRKQYKLLQDNKQSSITKERIDLLNELDFAWNAQEAAWTRHMDDLKQFRKKNGHCHVPLNDPKYPKLGLWVKEQRRHYTLMKQGKLSHMTKERCEELSSLGFCYDTHESTWLERLRELADFKEEHGSCIVPSSYAKNTKLATWVHHQRRQYKKFKEGKHCHITEDRIRALDKIGFVWHPRQSASDLDDDDSTIDDESVVSGEDQNDSVSDDCRPSKRHKRF